MQTDSTPNQAETRDRVLDAAEALFGEQGFERTNVRDLTERAGVNLAAINYHFGGKEALHRAVFARRLLPFCAWRLEQLNTAEAAAKGKPLPVRKLVELYFGSFFRFFPQRTDRRPHPFFALLARTLAAENLTAISVFPPEFITSQQRYLQAFQRSLPSLTALQLVWRLRSLTVGFMHTFTRHDQLPLLISGPIPSGDLRQLFFEETLAATEAALKAPPAKRPDNVI